MAYGIKRRKFVCFFRGHKLRPSRIKGEMHLWYHTYCCRCGESWSGVTGLPKKWKKDKDGKSWPVGHVK